MTTLCGGGTSSPKFDTQAITTMSLGAIFQLLSKYEAPWLIPASAMLSLVPLEMATFCGTDPPTISNLTTAEATALLQLDFGTDFYNALGKFKNIVLQMMWYEFCQCDVGSPTTFTPPTAPTDTPIYVPPVAGTATPCASYTGGPSALVASTFTNVLHLIAIPLGATSVELTLHNATAGAGPHGGVQWSIKQYPPESTTSLATSSPIMASGATLVLDIPIVPGCAVMDASATPGPANNSDTVAAEAVVSCGGNIAGDPLPTAPPLAPVDSARIEQILQMVTLIQRQEVPFAFIARATHTDLTGTGQIDVQGLIGALIELTTVPDYIGRRGSDPEVLFDAAWWAWGTDDGLEPLVPIRYRGAIILPDNAGAYTRLAYILEAGVVATITELVREP